MVLNKKIVFLMACISLFLCIMTLQDTYAKYATTTSGTGSLSIARWRILVNNYDVTQNLTSNSIITPVFSGSTHIAPDIIAPTSEGYFDIIIDASDTDVSFNYTINLANNATSSVQDLTLKDYDLTIGEDSEEDLEITDSKITGTINLNDEIKVHKYRVYIFWNDGDGQTMNNVSDTNATPNNSDITDTTRGTAKIDVNVNFIQKTN